MMRVSKTEQCPACGTPTSDWLGENCPVCLMHLGRLVLSPESTECNTSAKVNWETIRHLGDYELQEEIARGGMGVVYRARQLSLNRMVAVKVLLAGQFANEKFIRRFRREAEAAASLNHPNIVSIYEVGEYEGQPYFSMELIEGRSLAELTRDSPLAARRAVQLVKAISEAVHFAHGRRLLHRDLKPSNVLVDASDQPHITDFGLAKRMEGDSDLTLTGQVLGTPNYMSPEQADPKRGETTLASDVYALGAILYHITTGRPPFMAETLTQTLRLVTETEAVMPRLLNPGLPRDLETICTKCLEKDPDRRYASAQDLANELGRFLEDKPILARPISGGEKFVRWCRRKPALASAIAIAMILLLTVAIGSPIAIIRINGERQRAERAGKQEVASRVRAESAELETRRQLFNSLLKQAQITIRSGELGQRVGALEALRQAATVSNTLELRREAFAALALPDLRFERAITIPGNQTMSELDPNFERIAICHGKGPVEIRSMSDNRLLASLPAHTNLPGHYGLWSPDGRYFAAKRDIDPAGRIGSWGVWDLATTTRVLVLHEVPLGAISFHPRLPQLLTAREGQIVNWDLLSGQESNRFKLAEERILQLRVSPDGTRLAAFRTTKQGQWISVNRIHDGKEWCSYKLADGIGDLNWDPTGHWIAVTDYSGGVRLIDSQTGESKLLGHHEAQAVRASFSPDGHYLITGGWELALICWDMSRMERAFNIGLDSFVPRFSADGRRCVFGRGLENHLWLYTFEYPTACREFPEDLGTQLNSAIFSADGRWLAAQGQQRIGVWDLTKDSPGAVAEPGGPSRLFLTPNGSELFVSYGEVDCSRWHILPSANNTSPPQLKREALPKPEKFVSICVASNMAIWTVADGSRIVPLGGNLDPGKDQWLPTVRGMAWISANERWLGIFRSFSPLLNFYSLPDLDPVVTLTNRGSIRRFAFSPNGNELAVASQKFVEFWDTTSWQRTREITNFMDIVYAADGRALWLVRDFRTAGLYDAKTMQLLLPLPKGALPLGLSPDGRKIVVCVNQRRLQLWDLPKAREQLQDCSLNWSDK